MRIRLSGVLYSLSALLLLAITGCGANSAGTVAGGPSEHLTAKIVSSATDIASIRLIVTGPGVPIAKKVVAGNSGGTLEVYPGSNLIVTAQAFKADGTMAYEGAATDVTVIAGQPASVTVVLNPPVIKAENAQCLSCHESTRDITGQNLVASYKQSGHYTNTGWTYNPKNGGTLPGCAGCHGTQHNDTMPSMSGRCYECHTAISLKHVANVAAGGFAVQFVSSPNHNNCSACHEPHNPLGGIGKDERKTWQASGHGDIAGAPWMPSSSHSWRTSGSTANFQTGAPASDCLRCHTADGYAKFVDSGYADVTNLTGDANINSPLDCNACHTDNKFTVRPASAFTARYNAGNTSKTFPNVGTSNLCIACHSARESGETILGISTNMNSTGFKNSHYMGAAATMYMSNAFINFTSLTAPVATNNELNADGTKATFASSKPYAKNNLPDNLSVPGYGIVGGTTSAHRRIGTPLITGTETYLTYSSATVHTKNPAAKTAISTNGPCVSCHMQADNAIAGVDPEAIGIPVPAFRPGHGHSLKIDESTAQQLCLPCHAEQHLDGGDGKGNALYTVTHDLATITKAQIEPQSNCYQNGLNLLKQILLTKYMIKYDPTAYPYFYDLKKDATGKTAVTDWTRANVAGVTDAAVLALGPTFTPVPAGGYNDMQAKRLMGACFNLNLLARDPGGYAHARTFVQRLVYDSLDYLDNNTMDFTALTSSRALNPTIYYGTNINVRASNGTLASESMIWMSGTHYNDPGAIAGVNTLLKPMKLHP